MEFQWIVGLEPAFEDARAVRRKVFVEEQGYSLIGEFDEQDKDALHIIGYEDGRPVCTARMFTEAPGIYHIGRVAVLSSCRGCGYGLVLMRQVEKKVRQLKGHKLFLNAQQDKAGFYQRAGFNLTGVELLDEGQPHVEMVRLLR